MISLHAQARSIDEVSRFKEKRAGHYGRINLKELRKMQEEEDEEEEG